MSETPAIWPSCVRCPDRLVHIIHLVHFVHPHDHLVPHVLEVRGVPWFVVGIFGVGFLGLIDGFSGCLLAS